MDYSFFVMKTEGSGQYTVSSTGEILIFDELKTVTGTGYDVTTGNYTTQTHGDYVFTFNIIVVEGIVMITLKSDQENIVQQIGKSINQSTEPVTGTVIITLSSGVSVYMHVQSLTSASKIMLSNCWFAGWLQNPYDPPSP